MKLSKKIIFPLTALFVAIVAPLAIDFGHFMYSMVLILLYMYWASAWNILGGYTGLFAIGNGMYAGIGAYATGLLFNYAKISPWVGILVAGLVAGIISILVGYPVFRLKGMYYALATIALMNVLRIIFANETVVLGLRTNGANGLQIAVTNNIQDMQFMTKTGYYYVILGMLVLILFVSRLIYCSKIGYYFRAIKSDPDAAGSSGVNVLGYKLLSHFISAFFTAMGGGFYAMLMLYVDPQTVFSFSFSIMMLLMCIVGGAGKLWGPVLGAGLLIPIKEIIRINLGTRIAGLSTVIYGVVLMAVIFFMPDGILGWLDTRYMAYKMRRKEMKQSGQRIPVPDGSTQKEGLE